MKRRDFLKNIGVAGAATATLGGVPVQAMAEEQLKKFLDNDEDNDRILVMIQLHGGNDSLNMLIPVGNYATYYDKRANIAIPQDGTRSLINLDPRVELIQNQQQQYYQQNNFKMLLEIELY